MSTRKLIGYGQNSAHPLLDDKWIACSALTQGSYVFNMCEHRVSSDASVCKWNLRE